MQKETTHLKLFPKPHSAGQEEIITHKGSIILYASRRWGKTLIALVRLLIFGFRDPGLYWWVGLTWDSASMKRAWRLAKKFHRLIWKAKNKGIDETRYVKEKAHELIFPDGFVIWFRTAESPESLQGEGIKGVVIDEAAFMNKEIWYAKLEPTTIDNMAWVLMVSTVNGIGWFEELYNEVNEGKRKGWIAREYIVWDNPRIANHPERRAFVQQILDNTDSIIVDQEYFNKRISTINNPFDPAAIKACIHKGVYERPYDKRFIYTGRVDASGGGKCQYTMSICHKELIRTKDDKGKVISVTEVIVQDVLKGHSFANTKATTKEYAEIFKRYRVGKVEGDKYSGNWVKTEFAANGVTYDFTEMTRSEAYFDSIPVINQTRVQLLDNKDIDKQFENIETKVIGVDHYKYVRGAKRMDDLANVTALCIASLTTRMVHSVDDVIVSQQKGIKKKYIEPIERAQDIITVLQ